MRHGSYFAKDERVIRSRLTKIMSQRAFIRASMIKMNRNCGKSNCWCAKEGKGHVSYYLVVRLGKKSKMIYIPKRHEQQVREWVETYQQVQKGINEITKRRVKQLAGE